MSSITIVSDAPNCGITYDQHYDDRNSFIIQALIYLLCSSSPDSFLTIRRPAVQKAMTESAGMVTRRKIFIFEFFYQGLLTCFEPRLLFETERKEWVESLCLHPQIFLKLSFTFFFFVPALQFVNTFHQKLV